MKVVSEMGYTHEIHQVKWLDELMDKLKDEWMIWRNRKYIVNKLILSASNL